MTLPEITTIIIAAYGAVLSTINAWFRYRDTKDNLQVELSKGFLAYDFGLGDGLVLFIKAINTGIRPVPINSCGLKIKGSTDNIVIIKPQGERPLPCVLEPNDSVSYWLSIDELKIDLKKVVMDNKATVRGVITAKTGKKTTSKPMDIEL